MTAPQFRVEKIRSGESDPYEVVTIEADGSVVVERPTEDEGSGGSD